MNCKEIEMLLADAVGEELRDADRAAFEAHVAECESCRREYDTLRGAVHAMRGISSPARVSVRREGDRLVIGEGRETSGAAPRSARPPSNVFRYAASILIAFLAGYLLHAALMFGEARESQSTTPQVVQGADEPSSPSLRDALVLAHQQSPQASEFAKLIMAMSDRS